MNIKNFQNWLNVDFVQAQIIAFIFLCLVAVVAFIIFRKIFLSIIEHISRKTKTKWDDYLVSRRVFYKLSYLVPFLIFYFFSHLFPVFQVFIQKASLTLIVFFLLSALSAFLNVVNDIYIDLKAAKGKPIKGYLQIISIFFYIVGAIIVFGIILNKSPWILISGLGAMTAVLLLIFKDTILSLMASLQISFNNLISIGDWLSVPQYDADGNVIDVALHTIKIQNWDKTITTIPTHQLINGSFKNWRGMEQSGGRRIKRAVHIDLTSIKFCDEILLKRFRKFQLISTRIEQKMKEIDEHNKKLRIDTSETINGRRMTNIGVFRLYVSEYLKNNPRIRTDLTFMIRQLPSTPHGLPIEIYVFVNDIQWANYEAVQADIFDHIFAAIPHFDLKLFQNPSGSDFRGLTGIPKIYKPQKKL